MPLADELPGIAKLDATIRDPASPGWNKWFDKITGFTALEQGWDSYDAPPPSEAVITAAEGFLQYLQKHGKGPTRLTPSVVGGVGFTFRNGERSVYVEFRNTGNAHAAFTDAESEPEVFKVRQDATGYIELIAKVESTARFGYSGVGRPGHPFLAPTGPP